MYVIIFIKFVNYNDKEVLLPFDFRNNILNLT
jgi:hypothetical protein